jgi:chemosensory pili system protein ChpC
MTPVSGPVRSLLIPVGGGTLLLPHASVAEIVNFSQPVPHAGAPAWLLGRIPWRGLSIPLVSMEVLSGQKKPPLGRRCRILVINPVGKNQKLSFYALLSQDIPSLIQVDHGMIAPVEKGVTKGPGILTLVTINDKPAMIPDLDMVESLLSGQGG